MSVSTSAARFQDISLNPQKLAGQCAKLKCCLNYEVDLYVESQKHLPSKEITLETQEGTFYFFKADILKGMITYSTDKSFLANGVTISARRAFEIISMNKRGEKPENLTNGNNTTGAERPIDLVEQESLTRFDKRKNNNRKKKKKQSGNRDFNKEETDNNKGNNNSNEQQTFTSEKKEQDKEGKNYSSNKKDEKPQREREDRNKSHNKNNRSTGIKNNRPKEKERQKETQLPPSNE